MATHPSTLSGKCHGQRRLKGCSPWGHKESDTTENKHILHFIFIWLAKKLAWIFPLYLMKNPNKFFGQANTWSPHPNPMPHDKGQGRKQCIFLALVCFSSIYYFTFIFLIFGCAMWLVGSLFPHPGLNHTLGSESRESEGS